MTVDRARMREKLDFIRRTVGELHGIRGRGSATFLDDRVLQAAAVRMLQVAIEAVIDIAHHIVAREELGLPKTYREAIDLLLEHGIVPGELTEPLRGMVRFRNRAVHLYDEIAADEVQQILITRLGDFDAFAAAVVDRFFATGS